MEGKKSGSGAMRPSSSFLVKEREKRREEERGENGKSGTRGERVEVRGEKSRILIFLPLTSFLLPLFRNEREERDPV